MKILSVTIPAAKNHLVLILLGLIAACSQPQKLADGEILFSDDFGTDNSAFDTRWFVEGTGSAKLLGDALVLREHADGKGVVAWIRNDFPDHFKLSFDLEFSNNRGIGVFFIASTGPQGSDVLATSRTGAYDEYIRGTVYGYSISMHRYWPDGRNNPGSNLRRNPGFHLLSQKMPDPLLESNHNYSVAVTKEGRRIAVRVDNKIVHDVVDDGSLGEALQAGKIGFRLRGDPTCAMTIDNVVVQRL